MISIKPLNSGTLKVEQRQMWEQGFNYEVKCTIFKDGASLEVAEQWTEYTETRDQAYDVHDFFTKMAKDA